MNKGLQKKNRPEIPLVIVGYDFKIASSSLREKLTMTREDRRHLLNSIRKMDPTAGLMALETCNRMEWIVSTQIPGWIAEILRARILRLIQKSEVASRISVPHPKIYREYNALVHVIRVVSGMESLAVGEAQIAGQFQEALRRAQKEKASNRILNRLAHLAGRMARFGYDTGIRSNHKTGIHGMTADYLKNYFGPEIKDRTILVAGMGKIGRKTASLLEESCRRTIRLNRTIHSQHRGKWEPFYKLNELLSRSDALIVATGAPRPVINHLPLNPKKNRKFLIMDIGIPLQVSESVRFLERIEYRNIDDLQSPRKQSSESSGIFEKKAEQEIRKFRQYCRSRDMTSFLTQLHSFRKDTVYQKISQVLRSELSDLDKKNRDVLEKAIKNLVNEYSFHLFTAFHDAMESFWSEDEKE